MPIPSGRHTDWPWLLSWVPRRWTAFESEIPPLQLFGNVPPGAHLDIPARGQWTIATIAHGNLPLYFAIRTKSNWYFRFGVRFDYLNKYYTFPSIALKHYK